MHGVRIGLASPTNVSQVPGRNSLPARSQVQSPRALLPCPLDWLTTPLHVYGWRRDGGPFYLVNRTVDEGIALAETSSRIPVGGFAAGLCGPSASAVLQ
jgi:hypothetical protein